MSLWLVLLLLLLVSTLTAVLQAWGLQNRSEELNNMRFQTKPLETRTLLVPTRYLFVVCTAVYRANDI